MTHSPIPPSHEAAIKARIAQIPCGSFEFRGKPVFWLDVPHKNRRPIRFICADGDGLAHVGSSDDLPSVHLKLEDLASKGLVASSRDEASYTIHCIGLRAPGCSGIASETLSNTIQTELDCPRECLSAIKFLVQQRFFNSGLGDLHALMGPAQVSMARNLPSIGKNGPVLQVQRVDKSVIQAVDQAIRDFPVLIDLLLHGLELVHRGFHSVDSSELGRDPVQWVFERQNVPLEKSKVLKRRLRGVNCGFIIGGLKALVRLPPDWLPRRADDPEWVSLICLLDMISDAASVTGIPVEVLFAHAGGKWTHYSRRLFGFHGNDPHLRTHRDPYLPEQRAAVRGIQDMIEAFIDDLGVAVLARTRDVRVAPRTNPLARKLAVAVLFGNRGFSRILEQSGEWHRRGIARRNPPDKRWAPILPDWSDTASDHFFVPLTDARLLVDEGVHGLDSHGIEGLGHCVGGYWRRCFEGLCRIVSVRRPAIGGSFERVSTVEIGFDKEGAPVVDQHRGRGNQAPSLEAEEALSRYMSSFSLDVGLIRAALDKGHLASVAEICGYDWSDDTQMQVAIDAWSPYMRREYRGLAPDDLVRALGLVPAASQMDAA